MKPAPPPHGLFAALFRLALLLVLATTVLPPKEASAGPWARQAGEVYSQLSYGYSQASTEWDGNGAVLPADFRTHAGYLYSEVGLVDRLTAVVNLPLFINSTDLTSEAGGPRTIQRNTTSVFAGDFWLYGKYQLTDLPVVAVQLGVKLPLFYGSSADPKPGTGLVDGEIRLQAGGSLHPLPVYAAIESGYRLRGANATDEIPLRAETGITLFDAVLLQVVLDGVFNLGDTNQNSRLTTRAATQSFINLGFGAATVIPGTDHLRATLNVFHTVTGRNALRNSQLFLGVAYQGPLFGEAKRQAAAAHAERVVTPHVVPP